jgi:hypothetical protein
MVCRQDGPLAQSRGGGGGGSEWRASHSGRVIFAYRAMRPPGCLAVVARRNILRLLGIELWLSSLWSAASLTYACPAWELAADICLLQLQRLQNKALRTI